MGVDLDDRLTEAQRRWALTFLVRISETRTSWVYRTERPAGPAVLKLLKPYGADEMLGAELMVWYGGDGAARIYDMHRQMILMEWLDGPPLGEMVRAGRDDEATEILCTLLSVLHAPRGAQRGGWKAFGEHFGPLFEAEPASWPAAHRADFARATALAHELIATGPQGLPLHGDFHHDNIVGSARGWLAIDPKGLLGDPAYEVANVFRNPVGADALIVRADRIDHLATRFAATLACAPRRVLGWAAAHSALSACWDRAAGHAIDWDLTLLPKLLQALDRA